MALRFSTVFSGIALAALATGMATAQDAERETIVVTASRIPQDANSVGSSISVITADEIGKFQERFVVDALTTTPGLDAARNGPPGGTNFVFLRGADSYQTMVLIDGVQVNDPSGPQSNFDFGRILSTDIERIEILRGPQSTLYGGDAIGGVINIITKRAIDGFDASGLAEFGSFGTKTLAARVAGGTADINGYLNVSRAETDGFPAAEQRFGNHFNDGLESTQVTAGGHWAAADWLAFNLALRDADSEAGFPNGFGPLGIPADESNEVRTHERSGILSAVTSFLDGGLTGTLSFEDSVTRRHSLDFSFGESIFDGERRKAEYLATAKPLDWLSVVGGLSWQQDQAHTTFDVQHSTITRAVFGEVQAEAVTDLFLTAGGRVDDHSAFGQYGTYRLTAAYRMDETGTKLHAAFGTGFRAPSLYELYDSFSGNSLLTPETSRGWEAGVDQKIADYATLKATYFNQRIDNRIDFDENTFGYFNEGHTQARGVELEADLQPLQSVTVRAVYTYDLTDALDSGVQIVRRPRHSASLIAAWQATDQLDLTAKLHAVGNRLDVGRRILAGYLTADIGAEYAVTSYLTLQARIENISDTHYEEVFGYGTAGRAAYGGFSVHY